MSEAEAPDHDDFMERVLGLRYGGYNGEVDQNIYRVAEIIVDDFKTRSRAHNDHIASRLGLAPSHVELIQYLLCAVFDEYVDGRWRSAFTYGTSPRGMFVDEIDRAERFLTEFREYYRAHWGEDIDAPEDSQ